MLDMVKNKQRDLDEASSIAATTHVEKGEDVVNQALSLISLQSLIVLLRNPQVKVAASQQRTWLAEVAAQYADPANRMMVVTLGRRCHNWQEPDQGSGAT